MRDTPETLGASALEAWKRVCNNSSAAVLPAGYFTANQIAEALGMCNTSARKMVADMFKKGTALRLFYRGPHRSLVAHYKLVQPSEKSRTKNRA